MNQLDYRQRTGPIGLVCRIIIAWALFGGVVLLGIVAVNSYSILADAIANRPFPGDFELTEMGAAIAVFCFLPYCQLVGANVSADIFTMNAGPVKIAIMSILAAVAAILFSALLLWRMSAGLVDYMEYSEFTGILEIPIWWAFIPALISLFLLFCASLITFYDQIHELKKIRAG